MAAGDGAVILVFHHGSRHPLPPSRIEGEVSLHSFGTIWPHPPADTTPLMDEARRGWGPEVNVRCHP